MVTFWGAKRHRPWLGMSLGAGIDTAPLWRWGLLLQHGTRHADGRPFVALHLAGIRVVAMMLCHDALPAVATRNAQSLFFFLRCQSRLSWRRPTPCRG